MLDYCLFLALELSYALTKLDIYSISVVLSVFHNSLSSKISGVGLTSLIVDIDSLFQPFRDREMLSGVQPDGQRSYSIVFSTDPRPGVWPF